MGDYTVIADVGASLVKLLREHMTPHPIPQPEQIGLASLVERGDLYLSLFLYGVRESGDSRRTQMVTRGTGELQFPPMAMELSYLLTVQSPAELQSRSLDEHRILGRAMQVLYDHSILRGAMNTGTLAERDEEVRIVLDNLPGERLIQMWNFADTPYRLSLSYTVGPIFIESTRKKSTQRVLERDFRIQG
ncbi:DUF4255 domain-containing protein [Paenibacillus turpanensis]|uniref:DUF4255 domain-containing protein n=1 Tax=Paenibacillus turpanensis TaxID=2689078 RepID=UPI00140A7855|nr:DUF4255 domain-containing protein [Paenibacillus turpanensis]